MTPDEIAAEMNGALTPREDGLWAILPAPTIQTHASFLATLPDGSLACAWFGGTREGKSDISIYASILDQGSMHWSAASRLTDDPERSEQNPIIFNAPDNQLWLFNTAQPAGNQDEARVFMRPIFREGDHLVAGEKRDTGLPNGSFIRAQPFVRADNAWVLPIFCCNSRPGIRWRGAFDSAAIAVSTDHGSTWSISHIPNSPGAVHMSPVSLKETEMVAFYRRRQSDMVHRSESNDGGHSWSSPVPTDVPNNNSSIGVAKLANGVIGLVCNPISAAESQLRQTSLGKELEETSVRLEEVQEGCKPIWGVERAPLALCISHDGGQTFPIRYVIEDSAGRPSNNSIDGNNKELSYPVMLPRKDGGLDIAYTLYRRAIRHVRLDAVVISSLITQTG